MKKGLIVMVILSIATAFAGCGKKDDKQVVVTPTTGSTQMQSTDTKKEETKKDEVKATQVTDFIEDSNEQITKKKDNSVKNATGKDFSEEEQKFVNVAVEGIKEYFSADYSKDWAGYRLNTSILYKASNSLFQDVVFNREKQRNYIMQNKIKRNIEDVAVIDLYTKNKETVSDYNSGIVDLTAILVDSKLGKQEKKLTIYLSHKKSDNNYVIIDIKDTVEEKTVYLEYYK